jgi:hypothetical protein
MSLFTSQSSSQLSLHPPEPPEFCVAPGEIWRIKRSPTWDICDPKNTAPSDLASDQIERLYSDIALQYLHNTSETRHVMIVHEPELDLRSQWQIATVLVLSSEVNCLSHEDLLIPSQLSGVQDLLAETWHVVPMLVCQLDRKVGNRLPRLTYDRLLDIGDASHDGSIAALPTPEDLENAGLKAGLVTSATTDFHQREQDWSDILTVPVALVRTYLKGLKTANILIQKAIALDVIPHPKPPVQFQQWLNGMFESWWQPETELSLAVAMRGQNVNPVSMIIDEAGSETETIRTIVNVIQTTSDDETLWAAVESLRQIDPNHPASGVRRVQRIDLGMQIAGEDIALVVSFLTRTDDVNVLLQVYPYNAAHLPNHLKLAVMDQEERILREVTARSTDVCIQLKLKGQLGEFFSVCVALGSASITELFVL